MTADVTVIIVAYRSRATIGRCLEALSAQTMPPKAVIVIENGSPAGERVTKDMIPKGAAFIENADNRGFAAANNQGAARAKTRWLALLNPDAYPAPDWLEQLLAASARWPEARLFGSTQRAAADPAFLDGAGDVYHVSGVPFRGGYGWPVEKTPPEGEVFGPCAAAMLIARETFAALGGFDERFFCYGEDVDLAFRARLAGHRAVQASAAVVDHEGYASSGRRSDFAIYHGVRNRLWTFVKNMPGLWFWLLIPLHALAVLALMAAAAGQGVLPAFLRGLRDGLCGLGPVLADRRRIQRARRADATDVLRAMTWNPLTLLRRAPDVRPKAGAGDF